MRDEECVAFLQWALPRLGLRWKGYRKVRRRVCKRVARRLSALGLPDTADYRACLERDPSEWPRLDALCRVTLSRFFRDPSVFAGLRAVVLPALVELARARSEDELWAWSAGCACGEEPYTLRLLWELELAARFPGVRLSVVGTDAEPAPLERARRAVYGLGSLRELPPEWRAAGFEPADDGSASAGEQRLRARFRAGVELRRQDLRRELPAERFHLVLCRNLAFTYFDAEEQRAVARRLATRLVPGGALVLGIHERLPEGVQGFEPWVGLRCVQRFVGQDPRSGPGAPAGEAPVRAGERAIRAGILPGHPGAFERAQLRPATGGRIIASRSSSRC